MAQPVKAAGVRTGSATITSSDWGSMKDAKRQESHARMRGTTRILTLARMKVQRLLFCLVITSLPACTAMIMSQDMENRVHAQVAMSLSRFSHEKPVNCNSEDLYEALGVTRRLAYGFTQMEYRMWAGELMMDVANTGLKQGCFDFAEDVYREVITTFVGTGHEELRQQALGRIGDVRAARMKVAH